LILTAVAMGGCSSDNAGVTPPGAGGTTGGAGGGGSQCTVGMQLVFSPAYSAYDGVNTYKVPVIALDVTETVKWTASDPSKVDLTPDAVDFGDAGALPGRGVMVTTRSPGKVIIRATAGSACGQTELTISDGTPALRQIGSDRYNNGVAISFDGGRTPACTNCHGATSNTMFFDVQHTPQQTGGYTDEDLINIFTKGQKPPGGGCRAINCGVWSSFHKWDATEEETKGIVLYLRSLEPSPQGPLDFGGRRDGG
jgi:hypothetical protein